MMRMAFSRSRRNRNDGRWQQRGQIIILLVLILGLFLVGFVGLATDFTNFWYHRQKAQGAADAACQAGIVDLLLVGQGSAVPATLPSSMGGQWGGFTPGTAFDCSTLPNSTPCYYAAKNGYSGSGVSITFPSRPGSLATISATQFPLATYTYMQVAITDTVPTYFSRLLTTHTTESVHATAHCALLSAALPTPIIVLHPTSASALSVGGSSTITILGGPQRSIQVNSSDTTAASIAGVVDLSGAGASSTGGDFGAFGGPATQPAAANLKLGSSGSYVYPGSPFADIYQSVSAPSVPGTAGTATAVPFAKDGCPDPAGCVEFTAGNYSSCTSGKIASGGNGCLQLPYGGSNPKFDTTAAPFTDRSKNTAYSVGQQMLPTNKNAGNYVFEVASITAPGTTANVNNSAVTWTWPQTVGTTQVDGTVTWKNIGVISSTPNTGILAPGLYYVAANGLNLGSNSTIRMSTATGDGTGGATFYFNTTATFSVGSNSGKSSACTAASSGSGTPNGCIVSYKTAGTTSAAALGSVASLALQCPSGAANPSQIPATLDGNVLMGPCSGTYGDPGGQYRGFLFFQSHSVAASPNWGGGGSLLSAGLMYFHQSTSYGTVLKMSGGSSGSSYAVGNIVADKLSLTGSSGMTMILNPSASRSLLKAQLVP